MGLPIAQDDLLTQGELARLCCQNLRVLELWVSRLATSPSQQLKAL